METHNCSSTKTAMEIFFKNVFKAFNSCSLRGVQIIRGVHYNDTDVFLELLVATGKLLSSKVPISDHNR